MLKVLYDARVLNPRTRHWGPGRTTHEIISRLSDRFDFRGLSYSFVDCRNFNITPWPRIPKLNFLMFELSPMLRRDWDVYWGTNHFLPALTFKKPTVITVHDLLLLKYPSDQKHSPLFAQRFISSLKRAKKVICVSRTTADDLLNRFPWLNRKLTVIRWGVNLEHPSIEVEEKIGKRFGEMLYVVVPGAHRPRKNLPLTVAAVKAVKEMGLSSLRLLITGSIHDTFKTLLDEEWVQATGTLTREQYLALIKGAIALLFPSIYEGFGLPILEAMAMGCPVIALATPINKEVAGKAGILLTDSPIEWAQNIKKLVEDPKWRQEIVEMGYENLKRFSWEEAAQGYAEVFEEVTR